MRVVSEMSLRQQLHQQDEGLPQAAGVRVRRAVIAMKKPAYFLLFAVSLALAHPAAATSYVCKAKAEYMAQNGYLEPQGDKWIKINGRFVFDEETGILTREKMEPRQMMVLQRGSNAGSVLASIQFQGAARYVFFYLRIETFKDPISFVLDEDGSWMSGTCESIGK